MKKRSSVAQIVAVLKQAGMGMPAFFKTRGQRTRTRNVYMEVSPVDLRGAGGLRGNAACVEAALQKHQSFQVLRLLAPHSQQVISDV